MESRYTTTRRGLRLVHKLTGSLNSCSGLMIRPRYAAWVLAWIVWGHELEVAEVLEEFLRGFPVRPSGLLLSAGRGTRGVMDSDGSPDISRGTMYRPGRDKQTSLVSSFRRVQTQDEM